MQRRNAKMKFFNYRTIEKKVDPNILILFPSLNRLNSLDTRAEKDIVLQHLACIYLLGEYGYVSVSDLANCLKLPRASLTATLRRSQLMGLVSSVKTGKTVKYVLDTKGFVALLAFREYQNWERIKAILSATQKRNDPLAYTLLTIGFAANSKPDCVYAALVKYAAQGHSMENMEKETAAESLLDFYRAEMRANGATPPNYLGVFKEFTTTGFQDVFRMLLVAIKPTAEDYNWLVEFFNEVAEFYYDPARVAYVNLLQENKSLKDKLEEFKKKQDQLIKSDGSNLEVTFAVPSAGLQKIDNMPPHLRAMGMRLILEPIKFINKELCSFFWQSERQG